MSSGDAAVWMVDAIVSEDSSEILLSLADRQRVMGPWQARQIPRINTCEKLNCLNNQLTKTGVPISLSLSLLKPSGTFKGGGWAQLGGVFFSVTSK